MSKSTGRALVDGRHLVGIGAIRSCSTRTTRRSAYSANSPGKRIFLAATYTAQYFKFGATTFSVF